MGMRSEPEDDLDRLSHDWLDTAPTGSPQPGRMLRLERGRDATDALLRVMGDALLTIMMRRSFSPVDDEDVVPVAPCLSCLDGGLRLAGTVRSHAGRQLVRACDTCGIVMLGERRMETQSPPSLRQRTQ